jgi:hypothetical protein
VTPEQIATLPDDLLSAKDANDCGQFWDPALLGLAAQRICDLEEEVVAARADLHRLKMAVVAQRAHRDMVGGKLMTDLELWEHVADVPWGKTIRGDG